MNSVMTLTAVDMHLPARSRVRVDDATRNWWLTREIACLTQDNTRLRADYADLQASAEKWIRLYEAALERANAATAELARLRQADAK